MLRNFPVFWSPLFRKQLLNHIPQTTEVEWGTVISKVVIFKGHAELDLKSSRFFGRLISNRTEMKVKVESRV